MVIDLFGLSGEEVLLTSGSLPMGQRPGETRARPEQARGL